MFGASEVIVKDGGGIASRWFILVLGGRRQLGKDFAIVLDRYGIGTTIQELGIGEESTYRILLRDGSLNYENILKEILQVIAAQFDIEALETLDARATAIVAAFAKLAEVRNT
jgi:hypothetical protein